MIRTNPFHVPGGVVSVYGMQWTTSLVVSLALLKIHNFVARNNDTYVHISSHPEKV